MDPELTQRYRQLLQAIQETKINCDRGSDAITLVAVSKTQPSEQIKALSQCDHVDYGENYVQELITKTQALNDTPLLWHFIGHLQSRKVKDVIGLVTLIHSVDSIELARDIDKKAAKAGINQKILFQVHQGAEPSKSGISPDQLIPLVKECSSLEHITIKGLMTLPPFFKNVEEVRPHFQELKYLLGEINKQNLTNEPLTELSMGMSHDWRIAIEEGATILRIGTALFGARKKKLDSMDQLV